LDTIVMNLELEVPADMLVAARLAHSRRDWRASYAGFTRASALGPLDTDDLDAMAVAAWRLGHAKESARIAELVFRQLSRKDPTAAGMKAAEVALAWLTRGDMNIGVAWMSRARTTATRRPICRGCGPGRSRWNSGVISPGRCPTAACVKCTDCNCRTARTTICRSRHGCSL
jgi:hypothetical protein